MDCLSLAAGETKIVMHFYALASDKAGAVALAKDITGLGSKYMAGLTDAEKEIYAKPWPHADQSPLKPEFACIQGLLNILPNGPEDGGLTVLTNSVLQVAP